MQSNNNNFKINNIEINNDLLNKFNQKEKEKVIFNFFNKLKLLDIQSKIYEEKFVNEINMNVASIEMVNKFFSQFKESLDNFQKAIIEKIESTHQKNISNHQELLNDSSFIDQLKSKYPEYSMYLQSNNSVPNGDINGGESSSSNIYKNYSIVPGSAGFAPTPMDQDTDDEHYKDDSKKHDELDPIDTDTASAKSDPLFPVDLFLYDNDRLLELITDGCSIDSFLNSNTKKTVISSSVRLNSQMVRVAQDSIEKIILFRKNKDIINFTNYFRGNEKQLTNTESLSDLLDNILSYHATSSFETVNAKLVTNLNTSNSIESDLLTSAGSDNLSTISSNSSSTFSSPLSNDDHNITSLKQKINKKKKKIPCQKINHKILEKASENEKRLKPSREETYSMKDPDSISIHDDYLQFGIIRSFPVEKFYEFLEGFCPMYVTQLTHYYMNKEIDRGTMLKFLNMLFDDTFTSANYYCQKIDNIILSSNSSSSASSYPISSPRNNIAVNIQLPLEYPLNPISKIHLKMKLPYLEPLEILLGQIYAFNSHLKHYKSLGFINNIRKGYGLDVKGAMYFDETLDPKTKRILYEIRNVNRIEISTDFRCTQRYYQYSYIIGNGQTLLDFNNRGMIPYCYKLAYEYNNYMFGRYSNETAVACTFEKFRKIYATFIDNVVQSNIHIKIGKLDLQIYAGELIYHNHLFNFSLGEYYRSMDRSINFSSKIEQKTHSLFCFLITPIFYFIYYYPHRFTQFNKFKYNQLYNYQYNHHNNNYNHQNNNLYNYNINNNQNNNEYNNNNSL